MQSADGPGQSRGRSGARATQAGRAPTIRSSRLQEAVSSQIVAVFDSWRDMSEAVAESTFLWVYGSPMLQAAVGIDPAGEQPQRKAGKAGRMRSCCRRGSTS